MKVDELLDENWKPAAAAAAVSLGTVIGAVTLAPNVEIDGKFYQKSSIRAVATAPDMKETIVTIHGKPTKVVYGTVKRMSGKWSGTERLYAVKED